MAKQLVSRVDVSIDGQQMDDFKNFKVLERQIREQVNLMRKTGYVNKTIREKFSLDYVTPVGGNPFDFEDIEGSTVLVAKDGGGFIHYAGVVCLIEGEETYDGEKESVKTVTFGAESRVLQ